MGINATCVCSMLMNDVQSLGKRKDLKESRLNQIQKAWEMSLFPGIPNPKPWMGRNNAYFYDKLGNKVYWQEEISTDEGSSSESSVEDSSVEEACVEERSVEESSVEDSSVKEIYVQDKSVKEASVEERPVKESKDDIEFFDCFETIEELQASLNLNRF